MQTEEEDMTGISSLSLVEDDIIEDLTQDQTHMMIEEARNTIDIREEIHQTQDMGMKGEDITEDQNQETKSILMIEKSQLKRKYLLLPTEFE